MKLNIKSTIALAAMLLTTSVQAQDKFAITYQLDGTASNADAAGTVVGSISGTTATLTVTPANGNYITKDQITVTKTISGNQAQDRTRNPEISTPVAITATDANADPSGVTTYTFEASDANYSYEVTANFLSRTDIAGATVALTQESYPYTGEEIKPGLSVTYGGNAITEDKDYTVEYANNKDAGEGDVNITGIGLYKGTKTVHFTITPLAGTISFAETSVQMTEGDELTNTLTNTGDGTVTYTSNDENVATVSDDGLVKAIGTGETVITATVTDGTNYTYATKTATFTVTVSKKQADGYALWVGDVQVTNDNKEDVLGHADNEEIPLYIFNPNNNTLIINGDQQETTVIESRLPELKIYIMELSKLKRIFFNNLGDDNNTGTLIFTGNGNFPGKLVLENTEGESAITGFSDVSYEWNLKAIEPDGAVYQTDNKQMVQQLKDDDGNVTNSFVIANKVTIGQVIVPITGREAVGFHQNDLVERDEKGNVKHDDNGDPIPADLSNFSTNKILITLNPDPSDPNDCDGYDEEDGVSAIYIGSTMTDDAAGIVANKVADDQLVPGGSSFAEDYDGLTFMVPAGEGIIIIDEEVEEGYEFHLRIGTSAPVTLAEGETGRVEAQEPFNVDEPTYCYLYLVKKSASARGVIRIGKRERAHGKIITVSVGTSNAKDCNPGSEASGGVIPEQDDPKVDEGEIVTGVTNLAIDSRSNSDNWYDLQGRQIDQPTKKGLYIQNRKKIVVK